MHVWNNPPTRILKVALQSAFCGQQRSCGIFHKSRRFATLLLARVSCLPLLCLMGLCCLLQSWLHFMVS